MQSLQTLNDLARERVALLKRLDAIPDEVSFLSIEPISEADALGVKLRNIETELVGTMLETNQARIQLCCLEISNEEERDAEKNSAPPMAESAEHATTYSRRDNEPE